jgi:hypothetical protein
LSESSIESAFSEAASLRILDANVRVGRSGIHCEMALTADELIEEMNRFAIGEALVSHLMAEEYDAETGCRALAEAVSRRPQRFVPAWPALPDPPSIARLQTCSPAAVRLSFGAKRHNFSPARWCSGELCEYLAEHSILAVIAREDIEWDSLVELLRDFPRIPVLMLEPGYRADRYLEPLARQYPNFYFDTSTYVAHRQLERWVERFGSGHVVFGSRLPFYTPGASLAVLMTARISDQDRLAIAGATLRRILRLEINS